MRKRQIKTDPVFFFPRRRRPFLSSRFLVSIFPATRRKYPAGRERGTTTHRSPKVGRQTMYSSRGTFLAVPDTNVSHPDLPGLAASLLQSTRRRITTVNSKCQLAKSGLKKQHTTVHDDTSSRCRLKQARCQPRQIRMRYVCVGDSEKGFTRIHGLTADF